MLASFPISEGSTRFEQIYSPSNYSKEADETDKEASPLWQRLHGKIKSKHKLEPIISAQRWEPVTKGAVDKDKNAKIEHKACFKGFKDRIPRFGLIVSSNDFEKILNGQRFENVALSSLTRDKTEVIADSQTLQRLFTDEDINSEAKDPKTRRKRTLGRGHRNHLHHIHILGIFHHFFILISFVCTYNFKERQLTKY